MRYFEDVTVGDRFTGGPLTVEAAEIVIVAAGMDGVLPTVTAGLFSRPVIAVPTSVGYGASFQGVAALLTMIEAYVGEVVRNVLFGVPVDRFLEFV